VLIIDGVSVYYEGQAAVTGATLAVRPGHVVALLGANGAGKSSLIGALGGIVDACGRIEVDGAAVRLRRPGMARRLGVAVVPEGHRVLTDLTVQDNLRVASATVARRERQAAIAAALEIFPELLPLRDRAARLLSGGEQQMLALAQAVVGRPTYLVVDELSLGLAPIIVDRLADALTQVATAGTGVLLIEQFTNVALRIAKTAYVMDRGRIVFEGEASELQLRPELLHSAYLAAPTAQEVLDATR
jgi:branched-chain amino acid transport system ATP-binding protein